MNKSKFSAKNLAKTRQEVQINNMKILILNNAFSSLLPLLILFHHSQQKPIIDAKQQLHHYGFLNSTTPDVKTLKGAIMKFQKMNGLEMTGTLNEATIARMEAPRCGTPSNVPGLADTDDRHKWRSRHITYGIVNWTEPLTRSEIKNALEEAIMAWTDGVNLKITESDSKTADILVHFLSHDGHAKHLAYASYPEAGDMFFYWDENWTPASPFGPGIIHFGSVVVHELGHALGLPHSENMKSIMFPYYTAEILSPSDIDKRNLRSLYGRSVMNNSVLCSGTSIDAILDTKEPMIIKGQQYWVLSGGRIQSGPLSLPVMYPNLPEKIDAAFMVGRTSYFLSNNIFYKFKHESKQYFDKLISVGFDNIPSNMDAAFYHSGGSVIYFFKGSKYYAFDTKKPEGKRVSIDGKDIANDWGGVPKNLDAASLISNSQVLFTKGPMCYVVDMDSRELLSSGDCATTYYGC